MVVIGSGISVQLLQRWMKVIAWGSDRLLNGFNNTPRAGGHEGALIHAPCSKNTPGTRTLIGTASNLVRGKAAHSSQFPQRAWTGNSHASECGEPGTSSGFPKRLTLFGRWARVQNCCEMPRNSSRLSYQQGQPNSRREGQWHHCVEPTALIPRGCGEMMPFPGALKSSCGEQWNEEVPGGGWFSEAIKDPSEVVWWPR